MMYIDLNAVRSIDGKNISHLYKNIRKGVLTWERYGMVVRSIQ
jgi:hypothetical protein